MGTARWGHPGRAPGATQQLGLRSRGRLLTGSQEKCAGVLTVQPGARAGPVLPGSRGFLREQGLVPVGCGCLSLNIRLPEDPCAGARFAPAVGHPSCSRIARTPPLPSRKPRPAACLRTSRMRTRQRAFSEVMTGVLSTRCERVPWSDVVGFVCWLVLRTEWAPRLQGGAELGPCSSLGIGRFGALLGPKLDQSTWTLPDGKVAPASEEKSGGRPVVRVGTKPARAASIPPPPLHIFRVTGT